MLKKEDQIVKTNKIFYLNMNIKLKDIIKKIEENSFDGGVGGQGSTLNYTTTFTGTPSGGNYTQNPSNFSSSDKTTNNFAPNTTSGSAIPKMPNEPDRSPGGGIGVDSKNIIKSPAANADQQKADVPLDPEKQFDPQVDKLFQKKETPSPDEIMSGLQYELSNMVKKDKAIAKTVVLKHLKEDPHYYSNLNQLNIDDKKMKVDEKTKVNKNMNENTNNNNSKNSLGVTQSTVDKTKSLLDEMIAEKKKNRPVENSVEINDIFKNLTDKRNSSRNRLS